MSSFHPFVSIIIPVFNDSERLSACLSALHNQTYPRDRYEIIVVDNGSKEDPRPAVDPFPLVTLTYEKKTGSYAARNHGIKLAKGEVVAFTDADCLPASDWLETGVATLLATSNCGLVAGKIELSFENPKQPTLVELYDSVTAFHQKKFIEKLRYGATANVFTFRAVLGRVGGFNDSLKSNGDREWGQRVYKAGYQQVYGESTRVAHPARRSFAELFKRTIRITGGHYDFKTRRGYRWKEFLRDLSRDLILSSEDCRRIWTHGRLSAAQKLQINLVMLSVKHLSARERLRLRLGGISTRG